MAKLLRSNGVVLGPQITARGAVSLTTLIKAHKQIDGFEKYPQIAAKQKELLTRTLAIANDGTDGRSERHRAYVTHAIAAARREVPESDPCPTKLYAWRTVGSGSPGDNFVEFQRKGGQQFYTLASAYLARVMPKSVVTHQGANR